MNSQELPSDQQPKDQKIETEKDLLELLKSVTDIDEAIARIRQRKDLSGAKEKGQTIEAGKLKTDELFIRQLESLKKDPVLQTLREVNPEFAAQRVSMVIDQYIKAIVRLDSSIYQGSAS